MDWVMTIGELGMNPKSGLMRGWKAIYRVGEDQEEDGEGN